MDSFTYLIAIFVMAFSFQLSMLWISIAVLIFLLISLRSISGILLTLITGVVFFVMGNSLRDDILYIAVGLVAFAYFVGVKPAEEQAGGMSPEMLAALGGMGGGGEGGMGGMEGMGGFGGFGGGGH